MTPSSNWEQNWTRGWMIISRRFSSMDRVAQFKALLAGIEITKELDLLKAKGLAAITALLNRQDAVTDDARAASLIRGL